MSKIWSFKELVDKTINIFDSLGKKNPDHDSVEFLRALRNRGELSTSNSSPEEIYHLLNLFLDTSGIISATEGSFDSFDFGNIELIGAEKEIKGKLSGNKEGYRDWMCSILFQGWIKSNKPNFYISKDLRYVMPKGLEVCDFKITGDKIPPTLVECKRIHPEKTKLSHNIISKAISKLAKAENQFNSTERYLGEGGFHRIVILDISSYGNKDVSEQEIIKVVGLQADSHIASIINELKEKYVGGIDDIIICWSNLYYFRDYPRAFAYYSKHFALEEKPIGNISYGGWTVEFYPQGKDAREYLELFISSVARSKAWIKASWYRSTDNLVTFGNFEHSKEM